jgi:putative addiction module killer protein
MRVLWPLKIESYVTSSGKIPFEEWLDSLTDISARAFIKIRLERVRLGNLGNHRSVGKGVQELKIPHGPGYRIYFGQIGRKVILLLCGGEKSTQTKDINQAQRYWAEFRDSHGS